MKKLCFTLVVLFLLPIQSQAINDTDELLQMASILTSHHLDIAKWEVTIKENISTHKIDSFIHDIKDSELVTVREDEHKIIYEIVYQRSEQDQISYELQLVVPKNSEFKAELLGVIQGSTWNETISNEYKAIRDLLLERYFTNTAKKYTCLRTHNDDIIKTADFLKRLKKSFHLKQESTQIDTSQNDIHNKIIYGYTDLWKQKIVINNQPMNVQLVIKKIDDGNSHFIVGTPILINEY